MNTLRRAALLLAATLAVAPPALADGWPNRNVRLVVPYPPGGNVDVAARIVAAELQADLGQPVLVENRPGAGGMIAGEAVAKAEPDGHTLFVAANGPLLFAPTIFGKAAYHWQKDFAPISMLSLTPLVLQVNAGVPIRSAADLIGKAKAEPGKLTMASPGAGTTNHLLSEKMQQVTGARWLTVQYKGNAPAITDLVGGQVQFSFDQVSVALPYLKDGRTRALAVVAPERTRWLPDVPTLSEQGIDGIEGQTFTGLLAPAGTPPAVVQRLSTAMKGVLEKQTVVDRFFQAGAQARWMSPTDFAAYLQKEESTWLPIIRSAGIKAE